MARILIVEDETQVRMLAESILQLAGYESVSAATLAEAQALIHSDHTFDMVFTDVTLSNHEEGGLTVGQLAAKDRPGTPVLYTSERTQTDGMKSMFAKRSAFLPKPYTSQQLTDAVADLLMPPT